MLEVSLLSRLQHPYIGGITDHFHDGDDLCMVLELAGGGATAWLDGGPEVGSLLIDSMSLPLVLAPTLTPTPTPSLTPSRNPDPDHHPQP